MSIAEKQKQIVEKFKALATWEDRYKKIIEMGKKAQAFPEEAKTDKLLVKGCQSQVWLKAELDSNGRVLYTGDSDAMIVKGLLTLILEIFSNETPEGIVTAPLDFLKELGLDANLSPSRSNGLYAMIKQIKLYAQAFYMMRSKG